ncbi:Protein CBG01597 [Caenorhabditis briggsae]|uniref:Protein CBG01597 n=1 Tax=Caenorhabditis briggsae TaxID=6238 RepID=A8WRA5_CAEBR|nr:Protein CBG01597 [Caenorhabditis briggsae]CAP23013.1 Protein CBG01597 [Caenorhabditis briggsae]
MRNLLLIFVFCTFASSWVIYRKSHKKRLICREETEWTNSTANYMTNSAIRSTSDEDVDDSSASSETRRARKKVRSKRDIEVDPVHKEPIIYLGTSSNSTVFIDDGDFDIVSDQLTKEELDMVKQQIMDTCNALYSV